MLFFSVCLSHHNSFNSTHSSTQLAHHLLCRYVGAAIAASKSFVPVIGFVPYAVVNNKSALDVYPKVRAHGSEGHAHLLDVLP